MSRSTNKRILHNHELEVDWLKAINFIPKAGELIIYDPEVDADGNILELPPNRTTPYTVARIKVGDGYHYVNDLQFVNTSVSMADNQEELILLCGDSKN